MIVWYFRFYTYDALTPAHAIIKQDGTDGPQMCDPDMKKTSQNCTAPTRTAT